MTTMSPNIEPAFINAFINEPLQLQTHGIYEAEEYESGSFEKILAGLQQTEETKHHAREEENHDNAVESAVKDDPENVTPDKEAYLAFVNTDIENGFENLADVKTKSDSVFLQDSEKLNENFSEFSVSNVQFNDQIEEEIPQEHLLVMQTAENKLSDPQENAVKGFSNNGEQLAAVSAEHDLDSINENEAAKNALTNADKKSVSVSQSTSAQIPEENLNIDKAAKTDSVKEQIAAAVNREKTEKTNSQENRGEKFVSNRNEISARQDVQKREVNQPSRLDEMRSRNRRDRINIEVHNQRTNATAEQISHSRTPIDSPVKEITLELRLPYQGQTSPQSSAQTTWEAGSSTALENMLARELHQNFNGDIVRHASMVLRDGGEGTIKLALRPDNLGNVKIHLEMSENKITGSIIVESEEALNAFRREIASLEQAFRESGFSDANLNLSLGMENGNAANNKDETAFVSNMIALRYDDSSLMQGIEEAASNVYIGNKPSTINLLA